MMTARGLSGALLVALMVWPSPAPAHPGLDEQIRELTARIEVHSDDATLFLQRGDAHRAHGDARRALADYGRARRIDPTLEIVDLRIGALYLDEGKPRRTLFLLDRYLARRPGDPRGLRIRGRALGVLGRHLEAARDLGGVIAATTDARPASPDDYLDLARAFASAGPGYQDRAIRALDEGMTALGPIVSLQLPAIALELEAGRSEAALSRIETLSPVTRTRMIGRLEAEVRATLRREMARPDDAPSEQGHPGGR